MDVAALTLGAHARVMTVPRMIISWKTLFCLFGVGRGGLSCHGGGESVGREERQNGRYFGCEGFPSAMKYSWSLLCNK